MLNNQLIATVTVIVAVLFRSRTERGKVVVWRCTIREKQLIWGEFYGILRIILMNFVLVNQRLMSILNANR